MLCKESTASINSQMCHNGDCPVPKGGRAVEVLKCHSVITGLGELSVSLDHRQLYAVGYKTKAKVLKNYALVLSDAGRFPFLKAVKLYPPLQL